MITYRLKKIWKPSMFQGYTKKDRYFEGWYYKLVDKEEKNIYALIPGIATNEVENSSHSFIQIINGKTCESKYIEYPLENFFSSRDKFHIEIGDNIFSENSIKLNIDKDDITVKGELKFNNIVPWPVKLLSPGGMGWYTFVPFMECYHGILSLNHNISGNILINNKNINFDHGKGYMEKDWGTSFPSSWVWIQSNHFRDKELSLTASIANIPWIKRSFRGFIIGVLYKGEIYRFTTYTGAKIEHFSIGEDHVEINVVNRRYSLQINGKKAPGGFLKSPNGGVMKGKVIESMSSEVEMILYDRKARKKLIHDKGRNTGMEITNGIELIDRH